MNMAYLHRNFHYRAPGVEQGFASSLFSVTAITAIYNVQGIYNNA